MNPIPKFTRKQRVVITHGKYENKIGVIRNVDIVDFGGNKHILYFVQIKNQQGVTIASKWIPEGSLKPYVDISDDVRDKIGSLIDL